MKRALVIIGGFVAIALVLTLVGALLPVEHTARVRLELRQPPEVVYDVVANVPDYLRWRSDLDSLRVVSTGPRLRWRESDAQGTIEFEQTATAPPRSVTAEIQGAEEQGFGGTWTWELEERAGGGTVLTITERGEVYNPIFRLLARFFFSPYSSLERYARDLAARFGEDGTPERLDQ
jgi:hypothetical protein